jgi:hypothetical protein
MKHRKLRIAWSVAWGVLAVLVCVLWMRSYRVNDNLMIGTGKPSAGRRHYVVFTSNWGFIQTEYPTVFDLGTWGCRNQPAWPRTDVGFEWRDSGRIKVPDVFLVVVAVMASIAPWLNYKRFSLRTLLIATTLVAAVLGIVVWMSRVG